MILNQSYNTADRQTSAFTLQTPAGSALTMGDAFSLFDGGTTKTFEFVLKGLAAGPGEIPIYYTGLETASQIASLVNTAINAATSGSFTAYSAWNGTSNLTTTLPSNRVDLFNVALASASAGLEADTVAWETAQAGTGSVAAGDSSTNFVLQFSNGSFVDMPVGGDGEPSGLSAIPGDVDVRPAIGETIIDAAQITDSLDWGILVEPGTRAAGSDAPSPGSVSPLSVDNNPLDPANASLDQVGGVTLENNVISQFGEGGIDLLGDPDPAGEPTAAVPFFRVVNNTIYGGPLKDEPPVGVNVAQNSAPTLLNNIITNVFDAVTVDATSTATVLGATVYQNIGDPAVNTGIGLGTFPISLTGPAPLFVNAAAGNFYLAVGSQALNSAIDSLPDRPGMVTKELSLGLPQSPIIAPVLDALGQPRAATDPGASSPPGEGSNILIDRGAIERVDFTPPTAILGLVEPPADSLGGVAPQWVANDATAPAGQNLSAFAIQLLDTGPGIENTTVSAADITIYRSDNPTTPLVQGTDYFYSYDPTDHIIYLVAGAGVWTGGYTYTIDVNNSATGIKDIAGNALAANRSNGTTYFTVSLVANVNFSHAPGYPVAWHFITDNLYLALSRLCRSRTSFRA